MEAHHLPFDRIKALKKVQGRRCPHPSPLGRTGRCASFLKISKELHLTVFRRPPGMPVIPQAPGWGTGYLPSKDVEWWIGEKPHTGF
jgi:hypothetical protein